MKHCAGTSSTNLLSGNRMPAQSSRTCNGTWLSIISWVEIFPPPVIVLASLLDKMNMTLNSSGGRLVSSRKMAWFQMRAMNWCPLQWQNWCALFCTESTKKTPIIQRTAFLHNRSLRRSQQLNRKSFVVVAGLSRSLYCTGANYCSNKRQTSVYEFV